MGLKRLTVEAALAQYGDFDAVIDARSESEYALDHLPGAINWPTLTDEQRHMVGSEYKQLSPFEARKHGAALACVNIARHLQTHVMPLSRGWRPLVYCWRGGQRSGALSLVLSEVGFQVSVLEGGYRAFRAAVLAQLQEQPKPFQFRVLCGPTGSAKSRLLQALRAQGAQVLDLEELANHRGSVLGLVPGDLQPSQKAFETRLWHALSQLDPHRVVYAESESRTIGRLRLPESLLTQLRSGQCLRVSMPLAGRVQFLLSDYAHFVTDVESFCQRLEALRDLRGAETIARWQHLARDGEIAQVVEALLTQHYDPVYLKSMQRNFQGFAQAPEIQLNGASSHELQDAACRLAAAI